MLPIDAFIILLVILITQIRRVHSCEKKYPLSSITISWDYGPYVVHVLDGQISALHCPRKRTKESSWRDCSIDHVCGSLIVRIPITGANRSFELEFWYFQSHPRFSKQKGLVIFSFIVISNFSNIYLYIIYIIAQISKYFQNSNFSYLNLRYFLILEGNLSRKWSINSNWETFCSYTVL